ncbi:hypothetical protein ATC03_10970 [Agromyces aureus]|uniref:HTH luxR-type domain-containing protein n=1 Tax=Agromyces aureus TaxID=453304 RepID=A0A191WG59_9MICO|nr:hypothetical protein ATC03_10970 [Agromyces aureus]
MRLDRLLRTIREGHSSTLLLDGGAGVGKTTLLGYLSQNAAGILVLGVTGVQSEVELTYAALHQLCRPLMGAIDSLPQPQREALETVFGLREGQFPDKFLIGLAILGLLSEASGDRPVLCIVDDAQWLDRGSADVLGFVSRRLDAEAVGMVFAVRAPNRIASLDGLPRLGVSGLERADAQRLLMSLAPGAMDPPALSRILDEADGNPLVLTESARALSRAEIATGIILSAASTSPNRLEQLFRDRVRNLPQETQALLLIAAAEPSGNARAIHVAASLSGIDLHALRPAIDAELCEAGPDVRFRHPLVRSAVYRSASPKSVRAAHGALAQVSPEDSDPDVLAWHRARACEGTDENAARELADVATRVMARGGPAAAGVLLRQALRITADEELKAEWSLRMASAEMLAGEFDDAGQDLAAARRWNLSPLLRAQSILTEARLTFARQRGGAATPLFLEAAEMLATIDPEAAQGAFLEALSSALFAGRLAHSSGLEEVAQRWRAAGIPPGARPVDMLRDAMLSVMTDDESGWQTLREALAALREPGGMDGVAVPWLRVAFSATAAAWDLDAWELVSVRLVDLSRSAGDHSELPIALSSLAFVHLFAGDIPAATETVQEMATITAATGEQVSPYGAIGIAALKGQGAELSALIESTVPEAESRADATGVAIGYWSSALLDNSLGRYETAFAWAQRALPLHHSLHATSAWAMVELIEAGSRLNGSVDLGSALAELETATRSSGTDWALGVLARSRALVTDGAEAEELYLEAIHRLESGRSRLDLARTWLVYGEWLRRQRRLADARLHLSRALELFEGIGATGFSDRASRELSAAGSQIRKPGPIAPSVLTSQESQIARLVGQGLTNNEVAARMFLSPRTVEYHLAKVFNKLHITSRHQISGALPGD